MAVLLLCLPLFSQGNAGRIMGTVTDQSGGVVSGATVTVIDTDRGVTKTLMTNDAGEYNAPTLNPGTYKVRVEAKGFKTIERQNVVLEVGKEVRVDLTVQPGDQVQTITITESVPLVETTNATLGGTLNNTDINDMPLNGRNYQSLLALRPGVVIQPGGGPWTQSSNNVRPDESGWMLDGVINVNFYDARPIANMPSPFTDGATILPIDAIQEFNLEENPKAEYGWKPGAVVNVGVRSGTNTFHGAAYGFYRSAAWDARNLFNPTVSSAPIKCAANATPVACDRTPVQLKQFGGVMGGPIKKDKLFFFAGYEGLRSLIGNAIVSGGVPETITQATVANPAGDTTNSMVDAIRAVQAVAGQTVSPVSLALTGCTLGTTVTCGGPSNLFPANPTSNPAYISNFPNSNVSDNGVAKINYNINSKHTLNGTLLIGNYTGDGEDHPLLNRSFLDTFKARTYTTSYDWVWTPNSRLVNDARFGFDRVTAPFTTDDGGRLADGTGLTGGAGYPINTGVTDFGGLPNINITGFEKLGTWHNRPNSWGNTYYDFQDSVSYLVGKHAWKFGGEVAHIHVDSVAHDTVRGRIDFRNKHRAFANSTPLEDFYAGKPDRGFIFVGNPAISLNWMDYAGFAQDDWRVSPKLTLNLGLRYSYASPIKEANNLIGSFDPVKGLVQQGQAGFDTLWKPDRKNFSPRVGFAWDVTGKGTTVVRGGASVIYSTLTAATFLTQNGLQNTTATSIGAVPTGACTVAVTPPATCASAGGSTYGGTIAVASNLISRGGLNWNGVVFPTGAVLSCTASAPCNIMAVDHNLLTPYITNWSLGVQHAFTNNLSLEVGYVGTHGERLTGFRDLNQTVPLLLTASNPNGNPFGAGTPSPFPYLNFINQISNDARSNYHSLQATLTKRVSHGLSFTTGYTYAHGLDNASLNRAGYLPQDSSHPEREYGSADFDIRQRLTVTASYSIPGIKGFAQMLEGWKLNTIVSLQTPQPWQTTDTGNDFRGGDSTDRWDIFGNPADFRSGANSIPYCTGFGVDPVTGATTTGGVTCTRTSGVSGGLYGPALNSAAMASSCAAKAADPLTLGIRVDPITLAETGVGAGCFVSGSSVITPPANGKFGNMGRNIFRDAGFKNVDFSVFKIFTFKERYSAQFRVEFFNMFNHPMVANPYGSANGYGVGNDPSLGTGFGCGCATSDVAAGSPQVGSGAARSMQLGLKLQF